MIKLKLKYIVLVASLRNPPCRLSLILQIVWFSGKELLHHLRRTHRAHLVCCLAVCQSALLGSPPKPSVNNQVSAFKVRTVFNAEKIIKERQTHEIIFLTEHQKNG